MIEGWISVEEMNLVADQMAKHGKNGTILEIGSAAGRLFSFLKPQFPDWRYVAVDPWELEEVRLQLDWNLGYFEPNNLGALVTQEMFLKNCPFAEAHKVYFESWDVRDSFDVVSVGLVGKKVQWQTVYKKIIKSLTNHGVFVARNMTHPVYGAQIRRAIDTLPASHISSVSGSAAYANNEINYGSYDVSLDVDRMQKNFLAAEESQDLKKTGILGKNRFLKVQGDDHTVLSETFNNLINRQFDWYWEYFHSGEPAGLHTDYTIVPWDNESECQVVVGVIIPLQWNCPQPYTINYNRFSSVPRKLIYRNGEMRYSDNDEIFEYRSQWNFDEECLRYNPQKTQYYREYADLKVHSVYKWQVGTALVFDTCRWHSSSWFLSSNAVLENSSEFKRSMIGFGSITVEKSKLYV